MERARVEITIIRPDEWDDADQETAREVSFPDLDGEIEPAARVRFAFETAGHVVRSVENPDVQPRVWIIKLRSQPGHNADQKHLHREIRDLLRGIGWTIPRNDLLMKRTGSTLMVSFVRPAQ
jgi:hypothetical protein